MGDLRWPGRHPTTQRLGQMKIQLCGFAVWAALVAAGGAVWAQTSTQSNPPASAKRAKTRRTAPKPAAVQVIPLENAPPSPPTAPNVEAQQKAEDTRVLEQQKQQSAQAEQVTNQQVQQAQKQKDSVQQEVRIQDAPGPSQTGVVPAAGAPIAPVNTDTRIQDAPGPAQTSPRVPSPASPAAPPPL